MRKYIISGIFLITFIAVYLFFDGKYTDWRMNAVIFAELVSVGGAIGVLLPKWKSEAVSVKKKEVKKSIIFTALVCIVLMPITVLAGVYLFGDRRYYIISMLLIAEIMIPFFVSFEKRRPNVGEIVIVSVMSAIFVAGRVVFSPLSQFKPTLAIVIIAGAVFGGETGFLIGAIGTFVSNIFFGQGPWTPWQMLATGMVGFLAGVIFNNLAVKRTKVNLCIYGVLSAILIHGGIMNPASVIMYQPEVTKGAIVSFYISGFPFDLILSQSTAFFLWLFAVPMMEKLERFKMKYGFLQ